MFINAYYSNHVEIEVYMKSRNYIIHLAITKDCTDFDATKIDSKNDIEKYQLQLMAEVELKIRMMT